MQHESNSSDNVSSALTVLQSTLLEFQSDCQEWERDIDALLEAVDELEVDDVPNPVIAFAEQQVQMEDDLSALRQLIEYQHQCYVKGITRQPEGSAETVPRDLGDVLAQIQKLQSSKD